MRTLLSLGILISAFALAKDDCRRKLLGGEELANAIEQNVQIDLETHELLDFLEEGEDNLALARPAANLEAYQYIRALVEETGFTEITDPTVPGKTYRVPSLFVDGIEAADGLRVIGQAESIHEFWQAMVEMSRGDRSGRTLILFLGPPGTGKSELAKIILNAIRYHSRHTSQYFRYTYEWDGEKLAQIPGIRNRLKTDRDPEGNIMYLPIEAILHDSPIALLPEKYQDFIEKQLTDATIAKLGAKPIVQRSLNPQCEIIKNAVLAHYSRTKNNGKPLKNKEIVRVLNEYITVKRYIPSSVNPVFEDQGMEPNIPALTQEENPSKYFTLGPNDPHSYFPGQLPHANGSVVIFEEVANNRAELLRKLQRAIEDRVVSQGGSPDVPLDLVMLAAANTARLEEKADELRAFLDRLYVIPMLSPLRPKDILQIALYMKARSGLHSQELLDVAEATAETPLPEPTEIDWSVLFPETEYGKPVKGPDGRVGLQYGYGDDVVYFTPHTLMHMAMVVSASRMITDPEDAAELGNYSIASKDVFHNELARLRYYMGQHSLANASEAEELKELSEDLGEGDEGISARVLGRWLMRSIATARASGHATVTPQIVRDVFYEMLRSQQDMQWPDLQTRLEWAQLETAIAKNILVDAIRSDIKTAIGVSKDPVDEIARAITEELLALENSEGSAREYTPTDGTQPIPIDFERLNKVSEIFKTTFKREMPRKEMATLYKESLRAGNDPGEEDPINPHLRGAVRKYLNQEIQRTLPTEVKKANSVYPNFEKILTRHLGYNEAGIQAALDLMRHLRVFQSAEQKGN